MDELNERQARLLGEILAQHESILKQAKITVQREEPIVIGLRRTLAALMGEEPAQPEQAFAGSGPETPLFPSNLEINSTSVTRKPQYLSMTIVKSAEVAIGKLAGAGVPIHVDRIVREIYEPIPHKDVFYRIKRTVVSELIRGMVKNQFFRGTTPNTFAIPVRVGNSIMTNQ
jgi:hypothetical protein